MRDMTEPYDTYDDQGDYDWDYDEDRPPRPKILWGRVVSLVVFMLLAFLLGQWMGSSGTASQDDLTAAEREVSQLEDENAQLQTDLQEAQTALNNQEDPDGGIDEDPDAQETNEPPPELGGEQYEVQSGDSLVAILENKNVGYGCRYVVNEEDPEDRVDMVTNVVSATPGLDPDNLVAGQVLNLPSIPEGYSCP